MNKLMMGTQGELVGYLMTIYVTGGLEVICEECKEGAYLIPPNDPIPLHLVNVFPYHQSCYSCKKKLVEGKEGWPDLISSIKKGGDDK